MKIELRELQNSDSLGQRLFSQFSGTPGVAFLDSNFEQGETSYVFVEPVACLYSKNNRFYLKNGKTIQEFESVWEVYEKWLEPFLQSLSQRISDPIPLVCGYFGYEMLHGLENVPRPKECDAGIPDSVFYLYRSIYEIPQGRKKPAQHWNLSGDIFDTLLTEEIFDVPHNFKERHLRQLSEYSNLTRSEYCDRVARIVELIRAGEVYQVNLSQQFQVPSQIDPVVLYDELREVSAADYSAFLGNFSPQHAREFSVLSSSPERLLKVESGKVACAPIKGTRPRGGSEKEDLRLATELCQSEKDRAELAMIVDLIRNDLGKVCKAGTVAVESHAELHSFAQVHHLISTVSGELSEEASLLDLIKALFPCGSITGCPKIASMKYISELEGVTRGVYTGSIGWMGLQRSAEFNVAIRTGVTFPESFIFQAGGGVVVDSEPEAEYEESLVKASGMFQALSNVLESCVIPRDSSPYLEQAG